MGGIRVCGISSGSPTNDNGTENEFMVAYAVFMHDSTIDPGELVVYGSMVMKTLEGHPATILAKYGAFECLEGDPIEGAVILSFPSMAEASRWYHSSEYQEAAQHRFAGARFRVFLTEGLA
jgi:uncharacterized protein (DUF1330 family)